MSAMKLDENGHDRRATSPVAEAVASEQVDYPRILYVCEHCQENAPEMCGRSRDDLYVTPSGEWLCDECRGEEGVPISDCVSPPALYPASTVARLQQEIQRLKDAELAEVKVSNNRWLAKWERAERQLAEVRKALGMMLKEHDILSGNFGDVMDPKHRRPDRWPTAAEAARRALTAQEARHD